MSTKEVHISPSSHVVSHFFLHGALNLVGVLLHKKEREIKNLNMLFARWFFLLHTFSLKNSSRELVYFFEKKNTKRLSKKKKKKLRKVESRGFPFA